MNTGRLIEWDNIEVRVSGEKIAAMAGEIIVSKRIPIRALTLEFLEGRLIVEGKTETAFAVPFRTVVREIHCRDLTVMIPLTEMSAFGVLPLPKLLFRIAEKKVDPTVMKVDVERSAIILSLDQFLPSFLNATIEQIRMIEGGMVIRLGAGGADLPPGGGDK